MDKINFKIPEGCDSVNIGIVDGKIVTEFVPAKPEFEDGDIIYWRRIGCNPSIVIYKNKDKEYIYYYAMVCAFSNITYYGRLNNTFTESRLATHEEMIKLAAALKDVGKKWNPETKRIEEIKKEYQFKPFEKVLVRDNGDNDWQINFFAKLTFNTDFPYGCYDDDWKQCIPYEGNEQLLGTNKNIEK